MNLTANINNCTWNELEVLKVMFRDRLELHILPEEPKNLEEPKKEAPRKPGRPRKKVAEEAPKAVEKTGDFQTVVEKRLAENYDHITAVEAESFRKPTKKEALDAWKTEKYGPIEVRREYVRREEAKKALERKVRAEVMGEIALEVKEKRGGQRYPYAEYCKIRDERIAKRLEEIEKAAKTTKTTKTRKTRSNGRAE